MTLNKKYFLITYLLLWFVVNLLFLTNYPFVHSDESWLSGLSRTMIETKSMAATEDFFDLYERNPHAIKILYHSLQILSIKLFGYSLYSVRVISLLAGLFSLLLLNRLIANISKSPQKEIISLITVLWISLDIQFIYASHMARQEIFLILLLLLSLNFAIDKKLRPLLRGFFSGSIIGLGAGFHPNSFIIAWPVTLFILMEIFLKKKKISEGLFFLFSITMIAGIFVLISFNFNPDFIGDYSSYGETLGVFNSPDIKVIKFPSFYKKLFYQIGGTYHTPDIRWQMICFPLFILIDFLRKKPKGSNVLNLKLCICGLVGINTGLMILGKYSQPSIIFLLPFYYFASAGLTEMCISTHKRIFTLLLLVLFISTSIFFTIKEVVKEKDSYSYFINEISTFVPEDVVLGNLNAEYAFPKGRLYDWRNLQFLKKNNMTINQYIINRGIQYIVLYEELEYIYQNRPYWNVLYGNIANWYPQLNVFLEKNCHEIGEFTSPAYAMRIVNYRYSKPWSVKIYMVDYRASMME